MAAMDLRPELAQRGRLAIGREVGAGHLMALLNQNPRQPAHATAAYADEMHAARFRAEELDEVLFSLHTPPPNQQSFPPHPRRPTNAPPSPCRRALCHSRASRKSPLR